MTPLLDHCVDALSNWRGHWDAERIGITSPQGMLAAISAAKAYVIDEAETDTTIARDLHPGYFATTSGFYLPSKVVWLEYKAYAPIGRDQLFDTGLRSAFLATTDETDGIITFLITQLPGGGLGFNPGFGFETDIERRTSVVEGRPIKLRTPASHVPQLKGERLSTGVNFFMELVELINMPAGVHRLEYEAPRSFRRRLARGLGRVDFDLQPVTVVTLDLPELHARAVRATA